MKEKKKVLLLDDEPDFVEAFRRTMKAKSLEVVTTSSKTEAQEQISRSEPDMIVLGTIAPAGEAFSVHEWLRRHPRYRDIPLLVVDAREKDRAAKGWRLFEGMQLDSDDYVSKPIEPAQLVPRIQFLLDKTERKIKVLVADDHTMVRNGICAVLSLQKDIEVVGEAVNGQDAIEKSMRLLPGVVVMDIVMPVMSGLEATKLVSKRCPQTKILILTQYDEEENMLIARNSGASGFIPKRAASSELLDGVRTVAGGRSYPGSFN